MNDHIQVTFGADTSAASRAMRTLGEQGKSFASNFGKSITGMFGGFASTAIIAAAVNRIRNVADELGDLKEITGASTTFIQGWQQAVIKGAGSIENANNGLEKFGTLIGDSARDAKLAQKNFGQYGISIRDAGGNLRSTEDILGDVAERIKNTGTEAERASIAADMFGSKMGPKLAASLAQGRKAIQDMQKESIFKISEANLEEINMYLDSLKGKDAGLVAAVVNDWTNQLRTAGKFFQIMSVQITGGLTPAQKMAEVVRILRGETDKIRAGGPVKIVSEDQVAASEKLAKNLSSWAKLMEVQASGNLGKELEIELGKLEEKQKIVEDLKKQYEGTEFSLENEAKIVEAMTQLELQRLAVKKKQEEIDGKTTAALKEQARLKGDLSNAEKERTGLTEAELKNSTSSRLAPDRAKQARKDAILARAEQLRLSGDAEGAGKLMDQAAQIENKGDPNSKEARFHQERIDRIKRLQPANKSVIAAMEKDHQNRWGGINSLKPSQKDGGTEEQKNAVLQAMKEFHDYCKKNGLPTTTTFTNQ